MLHEHTHAHTHTHKMSHMYNYNNNDASGCQWGRGLSTLATYYYKLNWNYERIENLDSKAVA